MSSKGRNKKESRLVSGDEEELLLSVINRVVSISELEEGSGVAVNKTENLSMESTKQSEVWGQKEAAIEKINGLCIQKDLRCQNFGSKCAEAEAEKELDGYDDEDKDVNPYFNLQTLRHHYPVRSHLVFLWKGARPNPASNKHLSKLPIGTVVNTTPASADEYESDSSTSSDAGSLSECPRFNSFLSRGYSSFVYVCCKHYFVVLCLYIWCILYILLIDKITFLFSHALESSES